MKVLPIELTEAVGYYCDAARCKKILDAGFDVNTQDSFGSTILMIAVTPDRFGDINGPRAILKLTEFLLEQGADPEIVDKDGRKAADYARQFLDPEWRDECGYPLRLDEADVQAMNEVVELLEIGQ